MTARRIVEIIKSRGEFVVTWHYRNDALRRAVTKLCQHKVLWCRASRRGEATYVLHKDFNPCS